jgi:hypothetical protein
MVSNLHWRPIPGGTYVDDSESLKLILRDRHGMYGSDDPIRLGTESIPFLEGLAAGRVGGAEKLIELIRMHGEIEIYEAN